MSEENLENNSVVEGLDAGQKPVENIETPEKENAEVGSEVESPEEGEPKEPEKVTKTQEELDGEYARIRKIAERKAKAKADYEINVRLEQKVQEIKAQQEAHQQASAQQEKTFWDENLQRHIPSNMTLEQYQNLVLNPNQPIIGQNTQQQTKQFVQNQVQQSQERYSDAAQLQAIECDVDFESDFKHVLKAGQPSVTMLNAVAQDDNGVKNLYHKLKEDPAFCFKLSQLSPQEQQHRMWELNQEMSKKTPKKVVSSATPQPASIKAGTNLPLNEDSMSISELRNYHRKKDLEKIRLR